MIMRLWLISGFLIVVIAWVLTVPLSPQPFQGSTLSAAGKYRSAALLPKSGEFFLSEEIGHEVFEIPETDEQHLAEEAAAGVPEPMPGMAEGAEEQMGGAGLMIMPAGMAGMAQRTVQLDMIEWGFRPGGLTVKQGEVVRLVVRNAGNVPHEFMIMPMAGMAAVSYRLERADWNLTEHEAPFERAVVLPGDSFEVVLRADQAGSWMFMCMFPYHMQFGMMGVMATEGVSTDGGMGGMKM